VSRIPVREDVSPSARPKISKALRLKVFEKRKGICWRCRLPILGIKEKWIVEHVVARGLMGEDSIENYWPCHEHCRREKDKEDVAAIAKVKRIKQRNLGIRDKKYYNWGKNSLYKKKLNGEVVRRDDD
jgi:5-methylcytosine-specific restriction protein A